MSSHHFVREGQEPALILANGAPCSMELLNEVSGWCPLVMVLDGAYYKAMERNLYFDILLGDFDSIGSVPKHFPFPVEVHHTPDQNKTDLQKGIDLLLDRGVEAAHILWGTGGRLDHTLANINTLAQNAAQLNLTLIDDHSVMYCLQSPFVKYFKQGTNLSLVPITPVENIQTHNLDYNLHSERLEPAGRFGSSNRVSESGLVHISFSQGTLCLIESSNR